MTLYILRSTISYKMVFTSTIQGSITLYNNKSLSMIAWPKLEYHRSGYLKMSSATSNSVTSVIVKFIAKVHY